ncbi:MAG: nucleoside recognition domain-containing protein, partial [Myxococcota bacterium]
AINTSNIALLPTGMIGLRASLGAEVPGSILVPTFLSTLCSTTAAIIAAKFFQRFFPLPERPVELDSPTESAGDAAPDPGDLPDTSESEALIHAGAPGGSTAERWAARVMSVLVVGALGYAAWGTWGQLIGDGATPYASAGHFIATSFSLVKIAASEWLLAVLIIVIALFGLGRGVKVYEVVVTGAKEGFQVALRIIPFLVAMLVAVGMLRASGAIDVMVNVLSPVTNFVGMPAEALPMALVRSLSGSGAFAVASEVMTVHGPDSLIGNMVSVMQGSSDTTFYVLAIYFGVIQIKNTRHTLIACLIADTVGALAAVWFTRLFIS